MTTRSKMGITKPNPRYALTSSTLPISPIPTSHLSALSDPNWKAVMLDEYEALIRNITWELVPWPSNANIIRCMWIFRHKLRSNGDLERYKARLVANGRSNRLAWIMTTHLARSSNLQRSVQSLALLYPRNDILLTASSKNFQQVIISKLSKEFAMKDLGPLSYFMGILVTHHASGLFLSQKKYVTKIIVRAKMSSCNPTSTPVDIGSKLSSSSGPPVQDPTLYRSLAGALQYLTFTQLDISYAVQQICLFMHDPREPHMQALRCILRYLQGTLHLGLHLQRSSTMGLIAYTDADWGGCPDTR
ncbi:hypothetical protein L6452_42499 [Arctium lappa]|uniref:Uncharacterized protein n=1 Tax=Arctium lappa TaxID=4217 RepID=A0ACB8XMI2_ARCLA|nr:hypothetical protein L6452_42499 [Arctium lappa]